MAKNPNTLILRNVRASYAQLFTAKSMKIGEQETAPAYTCLFILNKKEHAKEIEAIQASIDRILKENPDKKTGKKPVLKPGMTFLHDGSEKGDKDGFGDDVVYISGRNTIKRAPTCILGKKGTDGKFLPASETDIYSGCYVNVVVTPWYQDNAYGKRVNLNIDVVQFNRDGESFGGGAVDANEYLDEVDGATDPLA